MKIIFSPSKEMNDKNRLKNITKYDSPIFENKTNEILKNIKKLSKIELSNIMKIKGSLLDTVFENFYNYDNLTKIPAISLYNGVSFRELNLDSYNDNSLKFLKNNLYILSAFYGISKSFTNIKKYRLDMTMKIPEISLYNFWKKDINTYIINELKNEYLLNLASQEYSKLIDKKIIKNIINIDFKEFKNNKYISISTYSKQARGKFLDILIKNQISSINELKKIEFDFYKLNLSLSTENNLIFSR